MLGAIRIMQPVHGYDVRRELVSWRLEDHANVKPGSIYGAMRTLEKDGCIAVHARESAESRPERTTYVLTGEGEKEFQSCSASRGGRSPAAAIPLFRRCACCSSCPVTRWSGRCRRASRSSRPSSSRSALQRATIQDGATGADGEIPEHVREIFDFLGGKLRAELDWTRAFQKRVREGGYRFAGDAGFPDLGPAPRFQ